MKIKGHEVKPGANLQGANLRDANLYRASLRNADLKGAILSPDMIWKYAKQLSEAKNLDKTILKVQQ